MIFFLSFFVFPPAVLIFGSRDRAASVARFYASALPPFFSPRGETVSQSEIGRIFGTKSQRTDHAGNLFGLYRGVKNPRSIKPSAIDVQTDDVEKVSQIFEAKSQSRKSCRGPIYSVYAAKSKVYSTKSPRCKRACRKLKKNLYANDVISKRSRTRYRVNVHARARVHIYFHKILRAAKNLEVSR